MSKPVLISLIVVFVLVDVVLGVAAWIHVNREPTRSDVDPAVVAASRLDGAPTGQTFALESRNVVMVDASADGTVIAARRGSCEGEAPYVRVSVNNGRTLADVDPGVSEVLAVSVGDGTLTVIGADPACDLVAKRSNDDGDTWQDASPANVGLWHAGVGDLATVVTPDGPSKPGCNVSSISSVDENFARVSCTDGRVRGTGDAGDQWTTLGKLANIRAASFDDYTNGTALARHEGCADYAFTTTDGGRTWESQGCAGGELAQALTSDGARLVAVVDDVIAVSSDHGQSWRVHEAATPTPTPTETATTTDSPSPTPSPTESPTG